MSQQLVVSIDCNNDLFRDHRGEFSPEPELAYVLVQFVTKTLGQGMLKSRREVILRDSKGFPVGTARLVETKPGPHD